VSLCRPWTLCIVLFLFLFGNRVSAQEATVAEFDEIVVTATRSDRQILEVPAAVSVVSEERLADLPLMGVKEALNGLAGVQSESKNGGYDTRLIIRGAGLKARYGVREIMILLDGVPITDPDGMSRLDFVDTSLIKQVDVVRGPNSTLYGANAAGGVVNFITRDPFEEHKAASVGFGSDNTRQYSLLYGTGSGDTFASFSASHKASDGWRAWNEFKTTQGSLKVGHILDDGSTLTAMFSYTDADLQLPGGLTETEFNEDPSQLTSEVFRHSGRYSEIASGNLRWEKEVGDWDFKPLVYVQSWEHFHPVPGAINDGGADIFGADLQVSHQHQFFDNAAEMTAGLSGQLDDGNGKKYTYRDLDITPTTEPFPPFTAYDQINFTLSDAIGTLAETSDEEVSKVGVYFQESVRPTKNWTVDLGVRYDHVSFDLNSTVFQEYNWGFSRYDIFVSPLIIATDKTYDHVSPRVGAAWALSDQMSLFGNISTGFQTPQASELNENDQLDPAVTTNYEVGFKGRHQQGHRLDLTLFYQQVKDEIVQTVLPGNQTSYSNAGETEKLGVELAAEVMLPLGLNAGGTYTCSDFTFDTFDEPVRTGAVVTLFDRSGNRLPYIPRHQYDMFVAYRHDSGFKARFDTATWGEYWVDNANSEKYKGFDFISKFMLGWEYGNWDLVLDISNLFDEKYAMEVKKSAGDLVFRPGAPRSFFAKASYLF